ncbi:hypothetical protein QQP08_027389 [Theobroma cacao]|nr:hypothetical protein QQP08_027389 [Theobroma cacao]
MEFNASSNTKKQKQTLPPRRGQVKIRIFKSFLKSVSSIALMAKAMPRKREESGPDLSSNSTPAAPTPTSYNSD